MQDDKAFNLIVSKNLGLDSFDAIITAQALSVGVLNMRKQEEFLKDSTLREMKIIRWKELTL